MAVHTCVLMSHSVSNDPTEDDPTGNADGDSTDATRTVVEERTIMSIYKEDGEHRKGGKGGNGLGRGGEAVSNTQLFFYTQFRTIIHS